VKAAVRRLTRYLCIGVLITGLIGCAGMSKPGPDMASDLYTIKQQFAGGKYRESLQGCLAIMASSPGCTALDQALYYAALNSLRIDPGHGGRSEAANYLQRLIKDCTGSPYRPEAEIWLAVLTSPENSSLQVGDVFTDITGSNDSLQKKDQEIKRLHSEIVRLTREIDMLKNVDVQLHQKKKDRTDGPDERKNTRP